MATRRSSSSGVDDERLDGPVRLVDYGPTWPALFVREAARLRAVDEDRERYVARASRQAAGLT